MMNDNNIRDDDLYDEGGHRAWHDPVTFPDLTLTHGPMPSVIILDCDYTLFHFNCGATRFPPFSRVGDIVVDRNGLECMFSAAAIRLLHVASWYDIHVAFATRNRDREAITQLLSLIDISPASTALDLVTTPAHLQAFDAPFVGKAPHVFAILHALGLPPWEALLYDDDAFNVGSVPCPAYQNDRPMSLVDLTAGIELWRNTVRNMETPTYPSSDDEANGGRIDDNNI